MSNAFYTSLNFDLSISSIKDINASFALGKCYIAYAGKNRNNTIISKQVFDNAIWSIKNIPVVGLYDSENNDFMGHGISVEVVDGIPRIVNKTVPFGVVPESSDVHWEDIEQDGAIVPYLTSNIILWKRQPGYELIEQKKRFNQSMEIKINDYVKNADGSIEIKDFEFLALCILGDSFEPCFEQASIEVFESHAQFLQEYKEQFTNMLREYGEAFCLEGGINTLEAAFSSNYQEKRRALENALPSIREKDISGKVTRSISYWLSNFDDSYAYVEKYEWYEDGGESKEEIKNGRFSYSFSDETLEATLTSEFEGMVVRWLTYDEAAELDRMREEVDRISVEYNEFKESYNALSSEVDELKQFKLDRLAEDHKKEVDEILKKFAGDFKTAGVSEFDQICQDAYSMEVVDLEGRLYMLLGKITKRNEQSQSQNQIEHSEGETYSIRVPIDTTSFSENLPYGGKFEKYINKQLNN